MNLRTNSRIYKNRCKCCNKYFPTLEVKAIIKTNRKELCFKVKCKCGLEGDICNTQIEAEDNFSQYEE